MTRLQNVQKKKYSLYKAVLNNNRIISYIDYMPYNEYLYHILLHVHQLRITEIKLLGYKVLHKM